MVHRNKTKAENGFTLVELIVVLAITAILAALVGGGLVAYTRLARFEKNESNARTLFQTAQIALTHEETAGGLDAFRQQVQAQGSHGGHFTEGITKTDADGNTTELTKDELDSYIYALYYDKNGGANNDLIEELLGKYIYDASLLDASLCIEIDISSGQVYAVFYDTNAEKLRFTDERGATNILDRSYAHRRSDSLVGYYSAEDRVNVVELQQTKLKIKNPRLTNAETLTLSWGSNSRLGGQDTIYTAIAYPATSTLLGSYKIADDAKPLFKLTIDRNNHADGVVSDDGIVGVTVTRYDESGNAIATEETLAMPLNYNNGSFVLTLDAMLDAEQLGRGEDANGFYSITRLLAEPQDIIIRMQAQPGENYADSYTASEQADTNAENTLFALGSTKNSAELKYFRHLYNTRWAENWGGITAATPATYTLVTQGMGANGLNWTGGGVTVYCAADDKDAPPVAKVPTAADAVAWTTIPKLGEHVTLTSETVSGTTRVPIINLQLRSESVAKAGGYYVGLVGENDGAIRNITLRDVDAAVNGEVKTLAAGETLPDGALKLSDTTYFAPYAADADGYRPVRAVGTVCGVSTGTLENITLTRGNTTTSKSTVAGVLHFDDTTIKTEREFSADGTTITDEPRGLGGLVGVAIPKNDAKLTDLTVAANVTVAGLLVDDSAATVADTTLTKQAQEKARYAAAAAEPTDADALWRSVGVGGLFGTLDTANMAADSAGGLANNAAVTGSGFVGGIAGNLFGADGTAYELAELVNNGTVSAAQRYAGDASGETRSRVLGQFFGGIAGYSRNVALVDCASASRSNLSENALKAQVRAGYNGDGSLNDASPLKGDFVGGLVGFGKNITMQQCSAAKGYVLGERFVGGLAGGFTGSALHAENGTNAGAVFGSRYVGGIVSVNGSGSTLTAMTNSGLVAGLGADAAYVGGVTGVNDATWGAASAAAAQTATLQNCTNAMSGDNGTDSRRVKLLQDLSSYGADGEAAYADYVGGMVGYNGKNGAVVWDADGTPTLGAILYGDSFVGGLAGYNDAEAVITNDSGTALPLRGQIVAAGDAVGGLVGMNCAPRLPAATVAATRIEGVHFVGGVIGANLPVGDFTVAGDALQTSVTAGRVTADGVAGGVIGYNRLLAGVDADTDPAELLPTFDSENVLRASDKAESETDVLLTFNDFTNTLNLYANAYVGGIVGYNDNDTTLDIVDAVNGSSRNPLSVGGLNVGSAGKLAAGVRLSALAAGQFDFGDTVGYLAGGIVGQTTANTRLTNCKNYGTIAHSCAAGGLTGWNGGTVYLGEMYASLGSQQTGYSYLGGVAGVNANLIQDASPVDGSTVRGSQNIGGVAGANLAGATVAFTTNATPAATVNADSNAGGVAGVNAGTIALSNTKVNYTVAASQSAGGIAGSNITLDSDKIGTVTGGYPTGSVTATLYAGGAAGTNSGKIANVENHAAVRANDKLVGGIAGQNAAGGLITVCRHTAGEVYATNGEAGGMAGGNAQNARIEDCIVTNGVAITAANGAAGGMTATNAGTIHGGTLENCTVSFTADSVGAAVTYNNDTGVIEGLTLAENAGVTLKGPATTVGGLAGRSSGKITGCTVNPNALNLDQLTVNANLVDMGGAVGDNTGRVETTSVTLDVTNNLNRYQNLGGVAGRNDGALVQCTYQGTLGTTSVTGGNITAGATSVGNTVGGIAGVNNKTISGCEVSSITLQVRGANHIQTIHTAVQKLDNATHAGGIAGRNNALIENSYVATDVNSGSMIAARYGFVGGVAGSNSGTITRSGSKNAQQLVKQVDAWLSTADANEGINAMVAELTKDSGGIYNGLQGKDTVSESGYRSVYTDTGRSANDLLVVLRGSDVNANGTQRGSGYLGGITGYNSTEGAITESATGRWFVYGDNITLDSTIGGVVGTNTTGKDLTSIVNCAAVRRFIRASRKDDDDTTNETTKPRAEVHVGGVIGHQDNDRDDQWKLSRCVNYGRVYNSRSNNIGGIVSYWTNYGGTVEYSFNFGDLLTNMNDGGNDCGTMGGIAAYFDAPVSNTAVNILHCQNHGTMKGTGTAPGANDCGGIFGKVQMATGHTEDPMTINIFDCVNGSKAVIHTKSMAAGIFCYLGPWTAPNKTIANVAINIERCRNYSIDMTGQSYVVGIVGNRSSGGTSNTPTTLNNCFALISEMPSQKYHPLAFDHYSNGGVENIKGANNYYIVANASAGASFFNAGNRKLQHTNPNAGDWNDADDRVDNAYKETAEIIKCGGHRLYVGTDSDVDKDNSLYSYFAFLPTLDSKGESPNYNIWYVWNDNSNIAVSPENQWSDAKSRRYIYGYTGRNTSNVKLRGSLLLLFNESGKVSGVDYTDITDEVIQNYYKNILDARVPNQIDKNSITILRSEQTSGTGAVYGRYAVSWNAPDYDPVYDPDHGPAMYYRLEVYPCDENGAVAADAQPRHTATVYETNYTFENDPDRNGWTGSFVVRITPINNAGAGASQDSAKQTFASSLPKPQFEVHLERDTTAGNRYVQRVVLTNADKYNEIAGDQWKVTFKLGSANDTYELYKGKESTIVYNGLDWSTTLTATAMPRTADAPYMRSEQYSEKIAIPGPFTKVSNDEWNTGLAARGDLTISAPQVTGQSTQELTIGLTLRYTPDSNSSNKMQDANPIYRIMLVGKYVGSGETVGGASLTGQYVTLAALQTRVGTTDTSVTFRNLPEETFGSDYTDLQIIAAPVESGVGPVYSRWAADEATVAAAIQANGADKPVAWYNGLEIVRRTDGTGYDCANLTAFYMTKGVYNSTPIEASYTRMGARQISVQSTGVILLQAPTLQTTIAYEDVDRAENKLHYTFAWTQLDGENVDHTRHDYTIELYGLLDGGGQERIRFKDGVDLAANNVTFNADTGRYTLSFCVDDDVDGGSKGWQYANISLHVSRKSTQDKEIGVAAIEKYAVMRRLPAPEKVSGVNRDTSEDNADKLSYLISWPAVKDDDLGGYTLYMQVKAADGSWQTVEHWTGIAAEQTTVDLEQYQNDTVRFYVIANKKDAADDRFDSPDGAFGDEQDISPRAPAPTVGSSRLTPETPSQTEFLESEQLRLTVSANPADGYYITGYLFADKADYDEVAEAAANWQSITANGTEKAEALKGLQDVLQKKIDEGKALRIIDESEADSGTSAQTENSEVFYTLPDLKPDYARCYLLPALRGGVSGKEASNWFYSLPDDALRLPAIKLDTPVTSREDALRTAAYTQNVGLYLNADCSESNFMGNADLTLTRFAVEWPAVNAYTDENGKVRNLTDRCQFTVTPLSGTPYTVEVLTAAADTVTGQDADGKDIVTPRGTILTVKKTIMMDDGQTYTHEIGAVTETLADGSTRIWYDLSLEPAAKENPGDDEPYKYDDNNWQPKATRLIGKTVYNDGEPYFAADVVPMLEMVQTDNGEPAYRLTLPDLAAQQSGVGEDAPALDKLTDTVTLKALAANADKDKGDDAKTTESDAFKVLVQGSAQTQEMLAESAPAAVAETPADEAPTATPQPTATPAPTETGETTDAAA